MFVILVFGWPVTYNLRNGLRRVYGIAWGSWGSLQGVWFFTGVYASLRRVGKAYTAMPSFCFRLWHEALEPQTTNITTNHGKMNEFQLLPTHVYTKPRQCRPKRAYANAYATYAICMGAYAWGIICLVEFPVYRFKKEKTLLSLSPVHRCWVCAELVLPKTSESCCNERVLNWQECPTCALWTVGKCCNKTVPAVLVVDNHFTWAMCRCYSDNGPHWLEPQTFWDLVGTMCGANEGTPYPLVQGLISFYFLLWFCISFVQSSVAWNAFAGINVLSAVI